MMKQGAWDYLQMPCDTDEVIAAVERALIERRPKPQSPAGTEDLVGDSDAMRHLRLQIERAARTDTTILITGASGTGKELVARALHANSLRSGAPLISLNCAAVPAGMIEIELFGQEDVHRNSTQSGLLQAAAGGTLFLDEVGDLPIEAQARLLRVLASGELRAVGSTRTRAIDVRIIAATHRDLPHLIKESAFREDLYYRLNVFTLHVPALTDRREDLRPLAQRLLQRISTRLNRTVPGLDESAFQVMEAYHWPGNVRELENALERAVILCDGDRIEATLLPIELNKAETPANDPPAPQTDQTSLEDYFVQFVLAHQDQLTETELANRLGISRKSLWERRQRLNIPRRKTRKRGPRTGSSDVAATNQEKNPS